MTFSRKQFFQAIASVLSAFGVGLLAKAAPVSSELDSPVYGAMLKRAEASVVAMSKLNDDIAARICSRGVEPISTKLYRMTQHYRSPALGKFQS